MSKPFAASELGENLSFVWGSLHSANLGAKYHAREYFGFTCFTRSMQVCRLPAATFVCNVHHLRALDRPQSPLLVHGHGLSSSEPYRKCQVASAPHQSDPTALSKGEKCQPGVVTAQRPTRPHLRHPSELTQARTLVLDLCQSASVECTAGWNPGENLSSCPGRGSVPCHPCTK